MSSPPNTGSPKREASPEKKRSSVSKAPSGEAAPEKKRSSVSKAPSPPVESKASMYAGNGVEAEKEDDYFTRPEFIYGGPFISVSKPSPFLDTVTPMNVQLQGTFKKSFAYFSLKERLPIILTKIIDYLSREGSKIRSANSASEDDVRSFMQYVAKLKNDLVTNKAFDLFTEETPEAKRWNDWIASLDNNKYFNSPWVFAECYVYRRLKEGCDLTKGLKNFDYFEDQKNKSFEDNVQLMCIVADRMVNMVTKSEKDKRKADFITLLKICLWANKCDLSLSMGEAVSLTKDGEKAKESAPVTPPPPPHPPSGKGGKDKDVPTTPATPATISSDPFQMILDLKDKLLVDDTAKIADQVLNKSEAMLKAVNANTTFKYKCSCHRLATIAGVPQCKDETPPPPPPEPKEAEKDVKNGKDPKDGKEEAPKQIPCPAKMTVPQAVMFGVPMIFEEFPRFLQDPMIRSRFPYNGTTWEASAFKQKKESSKSVYPVQSYEVRFHVKKMPWFISDVTPKDFQYVIEACSKSNFSKEMPAETEGAEPKVIKADNLRILGEQWNQYVKDGVFVVMAEDFWTYPHVYKDMKKYDYNMYRKLQYAVAILFKGDLNYRKLLGDRNCNPTLGFEPSLQGFIPAPIIAIRTVKADLICGLPRGKWDQLNKIDEKWMQKGDYGVIQYCPKGEALKIADRPCVDYCQTCFGVICPEHTDM